jgi:hypothetical protein
MKIVNYPLSGVLKRCTKCGTLRDTSLFNKHSGSRDGIDSWCRPCKAKQAKQYYWDHAEVQRALAKRRGRKNSKKQRKLRHRFPEKFLCLWAKHRAKMKGLVFTLRPEDIHVPDFCPVLGIRLKFGRGSGGAVDASPTLDQIRPGQGYVPGNVAVISKRANRIKGDAFLKELKQIVAWLEKQ